VTKGLVSTHPVDWPGALGRNTPAADQWHWANLGAPKMSAATQPSEKNHSPAPTSGPKAAMQPRFYFEWWGFTIRKKLWDSRHRSRKGKSRGCLWNTPASGHTKAALHRDSWISWMPKPEKKTTKTYFFDFFRLFYWGFLDITSLRCSMLQYYSIKVSPVNQSMPWHWSLVIFQLTRNSGWDSSKVATNWFPDTRSEVKRWWLRFPIHTSFSSLCLL
jgi:hypothetical protein